MWVNMIICLNLMILSQIFFGIIAGTSINYFFNLLWTWKEPIKRDGGVNYFGIYLCTLLKYLLHLVVIDVLSNGPEMRSGSNPETIGFQTVSQSVVG